MMGRPMLRPGAYDTLCKRFDWDLPSTLNMAHQVCDGWAATEPDRLAIVEVTPDHTRRISYGDLWYRSRQVETALIELLLQIKRQVEKSTQGTVDRRWQGRHRKRYRELLRIGLDKNPPAVKANGNQHGRTAQTKTVNLLLRLRDKEDEVLRFMTHALAQFDNNQAERDLRMNKVRQKVSGGFRSLEAAQEFMDIRSFVATAIKRGPDPVEELVSLFTPGNDDYMRLARHPE